MMYGYLTLEDETCIAHSEMKPDGRVKLYAETPTDDGFKHAVCRLPDYTWDDIAGCTPDEMKALRELAEHNAHLILSSSLQRPAHP